MVLRLFFVAPYYLFRIWWCGKSKKISFEETFDFIKMVTKKANHAGRVTIESYGIENIPEKDGFIFYPNHQGLFDVLVFLESCPRPFAFVIKKEASNIVLLKQVTRALGSYAMDREDIRQSMQIINKVSEDVKKGKNFIIFPEGTRSRKGNELLDFKGGSFKSATKAKCPIVPCALIDSFIPFDENSIRPVTVKLIYLPPMYYDEYKDMKTVEIAAEVKKRIEAVIAQYQTQ
ncbi:MAG: 1-acyl-sn-glycerol-3-phosphate acyltransferase [Lachnospiraceae bacterium]|nr:1-acyl-sn-glycerol-3-phosphate acyltransferase [Lachnospiraceae bacterium]